jgi:EAL domain-containing protein (putative c-di-GMP-specific phosphodiesterase class I)
LDLLRAHGIRIALDDFCTEYSSLSRLSSVPFDVVKIDRSFVERVLTDDGRAMVTAIHALARALGKITVAEGVETGPQLKAVQDIGCDLVQGYFTGHPVPLAVLLDPDGAQSNGLVGPGGPRSRAGRPAPGGRLSDRSAPRAESTDVPTGFDGRRYTG